MKVVLFGASGMIGSRVLTELVRRGHTVTAVVRNPERVKAEPGVNVVQGDINDPAAVASAAKAGDAAISAYSPPPTDPGVLADAVKSLLAGLAEAGLRPLIGLGGARSLPVAP